MLQPVSQAEGHGPENNSMTQQPEGAIRLVRGALGGALMGLANLVPGISGGTMLLATGVYTDFITAIAEVSTLRWRTRSLLLLAVIVGTAILAIFLLAGPTKTLVVERRWIMYSLFIGLTLGGVPLVWRLARPASASFFVGSFTAFAVMVWLALTSPPSASQDSVSFLLLVFGGLAGASAMILPGISGGYLLLLLGQYVPILGAIERLKQGLMGSDGGINVVLIKEALTVVIPVGIGLVIGVVAVSNLIRWLLERYRKVTLGVLMGLLLGAVVGLWPFRTGVPPKVGDVIKGRIVSAETAEAIDAEDWLVETFTPSPGHVVTSLLLVFAGLGFTLALGRLGGQTHDPV